MKRRKMAYLLALLGVFLVAPCARAEFRVTGLLKDAFHDPTDSEFLFLYVDATNGSYYAAAGLKPMSATQAIKPADVEASIGAGVSISGQLVNRSALPTRPYSVQEIRFFSNTNFSVVSPAPDGARDLPDEKNLWKMGPDVLSRQLFHRVRGKVLAAWNGDRVLMRTADGEVVEAELRNPPLPRPDETIDLVGLPETTIYNLRLNRATWQSVRPPESNDDQAAKQTARQIVLDEHGRPGMNMRLHGRCVRLCGVVRSLPNAESGNGILYLEDDGFIVPVNATAATAILADIRIGCTVEATGICAMHVDVWRPNAVFPRIRGYTLVTRRPDDIRILAYPPWLTPQRMFIIVAILTGALLGVFAWAYALRIQSERRGRQLAKEQIRRAESDLKVHERTRLAVELHDALSQSLAGVALELKTVAALADRNPALAGEHLAIADRSLLSCRSDLRNCLYDLRSEALEEKTMDAAIRRTLAPHIDKTVVTVRFNVPRKRLSDNAAHAILCIVRELTLNAIRHGRATEIRIAGALEENRLRFSVRDNGCGFDTENRPGIREGHFGLLGIRERVLAFNGDFTLESKPGGGTRATVTLGLPKEDAANG